MSTSITNAVSLVMDHKDEFLKVFPLLEKPIAFMENADGKPGCTSCVRKKYERDIMTVIMLTPKDDLDVTPLLKYDEPQLVGAMLYKPKPSDPRPSPDNSMPPIPRVKPKTVDEMERDGCPDCVCKHLSQALILSDEILQGYPEHVKLAMRHVDKAIAFSTGRDKKKHGDLLAIKNSLAAVASNDSQTPEAHILKAKELMEKIIENNMSHPLTVWRIIGHMGEAADECVKDYPELAAAIREERLALMENHQHRPPLAMLLDKARRLR